jgi:hypothetical protein
MVAEVYAGIGAFKAMFDMAKGLKDIHDTTIRNGAIIDLQGNCSPWGAADLVSEWRQAAKCS